MKRALTTITGRTLAPMLGWLAVLFLAAPNVGFAQGEPGGMGTRDQIRDRDRVSECGTFVDGDGDGICDLCCGDHVSEQSRDQERDQGREQTQDCGGFIDEDGDGLCDLCGCDHEAVQERECEQARDCSGFVDEDGDGVCDLCDRLHERDRDRHRSSECSGFVDEDGDGVCDLCAGLDPGPGEPGARQRFRRGDADRDGRLSLSDAVNMLEHLFRNRRLRCIDAADANDDGYVDVSDPVRLLLRLFCDATGAPVPPPFEYPGEDPTADDLQCDG